VFRLRKWYLDCVTARGDAFIGYSARLRWHGVRLGYAAALVAPEPGDVVETHTFLPGRGPSRSANGVRWRCRRLGLAGVWRARSAPIERCLLQTGAGGIDWACVAPHAAARIHTPKGTLGGLGYAECLTLTLEPWSLPFRTLHWGRFLAGGASLVWIVWEGDEGARHVFRDSRPCETAEFSPCRIVLADGGTLELARSRVLRSAPVVSAALRSLPGLARRLPGSFLLAREDKWLSRGRLEMPGTPPVSGWAIHEVVRFP